MVPKDPQYLTKWRRSANGDDCIVYCSKNGVGVHGLWTLSTEDTLVKYLDLRQAESTAAEPGDEEGCKLNSGV